MNRKMTRALVVILLLSTFVAAFLLLTGCDNGAAGDGGASNNGDKVAVSKVYIKDAEKPQMTFVLGNEPDFSAGKLTVEKENGSVESVALNAEGVTVTGYDKNTVGEQTVTFSYGEKATTLKVNVVRRMIFKGLTVKYFVGDSFDKKTGSVRVTSDDGKTANISMSDESITVEGFNAESVGTQNVTVHYTANGTSYTDTVSVQVYEAGNVKFVAPGKLTYKSHETELKINDAYFTITAKDDATLSKHVPLTEEMVVSGFDPNKATRENIDTPLSQEIKVSYLGKEFTFAISLFYSDVSIMQDAIETLKDMKWDSKVPEYTEDQGKIALEALGYYLDMSTADRALIDADKALLVVKLAAVYGTEVYIGLLDEFSDAFAVNLEEGTLAITGKSYEGVDAAYNRLNDSEDEILVLGTLLNNLVKTYGEKDLDGTNKIKNVVFALNENTVILLKEIFAHMTKLHKDLMNVPANWSADTLENYAGEIAAAVRHMDAPTFGQYTNYAQLCGQVSSWRERNDYLEIIYTYYINYKDRDSFAADLWQKQVPLPGDIQNLYAMIATGVSMKNEFAAGGGVLWKDTTSFFLLYHQILDLSNKIAMGEEGVEKDIYYFVDFPQLISYNLTDAYRTFCNSLYGDKEFENMYGVYFTVLNHWIEDGEDYDISKYLTERQDLIDIFVSLSPAKQKAVLGAFNYLYHVEAVSDYMLFDYAEGDSRSVMINFMIEYLRSQGLSEDAINTTVQDLFLAIEYYLNTDRYDTALNSFMEKMANVVDSYNNKLSTEDKALFDKLLGKTYGRYTSLYEFEQKKATEQEIALGNYATLMEELKATYAQMQGVLDLLAKSEDRLAKDKSMILLFTAYEKCAHLVAQITASTNYDVLGTYYNTKYQITAEVSGTMDDALVYYRGYFITYLVNSSLGVMDDKGNVKLQPAWNLYVGSNIDDFMSEISDMMYALINGESVTSEMLAKAKTAMEKLTAEELALFRVLAGAENYVDFMECILSDDMAPMIEKLQAIVDAHLEMSFAEESEKETANAAYKAAMADAVATAEVLKDNREYTTYLKPMYDQFLTILNAMNNNEQEAA